MKLGIEGRVAVVTGGSSGIGKAIAGVLASEGATVVLAARNAAALQSAVDELRSTFSATVEGISTDTTRQSAVDALVASVLAAHARVDILVNCAASPAALVDNAVENLDDCALLADLNTKVVGYARCAKAVVPAMQAQHWGRIISIGGLTGRDSGTLTGMRNVAICHLTKTLSDQLGPHGITVNVIHPGIVRSLHVEQLFTKNAQKTGTSVSEVEATFVQSTPVRRLIEPTEIGYLVAYLASPLAGGITGESIAIDGGITRGIYM
jgi:NAD(P)-dependent dehydrogenase (short-subunit alcohol dehydrogenase family)